MRGPSAVIKTHHNVGGLPERMKLEAHRAARATSSRTRSARSAASWASPEEIARAPPVPGPGLAVRILGEVTAERIAVLQEADAVFIEEIPQGRACTRKIWQAFAVLLPVRSVGVMGDERTYDNVRRAARRRRATDVMTADWARCPTTCSPGSRAASSTRSAAINRVVYDISRKPPGDDRVGVAARD